MERSLGSDYRFVPRRISSGSLGRMYPFFLRFCASLILAVGILIGGGIPTSAFGQASSDGPVDVRVEVDPSENNVGGAGNIRVRLESRNGALVRSGRPNSRGVVDFENVPPGEYYVVFNRGGASRATIPASIEGANFEREAGIALSPSANGGSLLAWVETQHFLYALLVLLAGMALVLGIQVMKRTKKSGEKARQHEGAATNEAGSAVEENSTGTYEKKRKIGAGGMSTIWLARDSQGRNVALKIMNEEMLDDEELVHKFIQEGKALERINQTHPEAPVINVFDYGYLDGERPFLALEYLPDESLEKVIEHQEALSTVQALPVVRQVGVALSAAHANGIYHRDVKPENVFIVGRSSTLQIKLIDFGVARHEYVPRETMDGTLLGSPPYMSPEQASGGDIGAASDIYSLGVLAYALLAGQPPFMDRNPLRVLEMHQETEVPLLPDHVPQPVAELVYWMLEKDPADRPGAMWEVVGRLDELMASSAGHTS